MVQIFVKVDEAKATPMEVSLTERRGRARDDAWARGRHKDKRSKSEKKQATNPERLEQKCDEESKSDEGPEMMHMEEALGRREENEGYQKIIEFVSEGSDEEVQQKVQDDVAGIQKLSWMSKEQLEG